MPLVSNLKYRDSNFAYQVPQGTWRWTTRMDTSGPTPVFSVIDIVSPYGLLRDSIPIPGDIVNKMSASITELAQAFAPTIMFSPGSLTFTLDEGRGFGVAQTVGVTNSGSYGSFLDVDVTSGFPYLRVTPANIPGIASGSSGSFAVSADSTTLTASGSPYTASLTLQDATATNTPQTLGISVVVRPKATITVDLEELDFSIGGPVGGPWPPIPPQTFQVSNSGPSTSVLDFQVAKLLGNSPWLTSFTPTFGTLARGAGQNITVCVAPPLYTMPGLYEEYLRVSGYSSNTYQDVYVTLTVT